MTAKLVTNTPETPRDEIPLSLTEFCIRASRTDRRIELLGAFEASEKAAGNHQDTEQAYKDRLAAFARAPA